MSLIRPLKVFLCHALADKPAVRKLHDALKAEGWIDPWLDEEKLSFGQHWTTVIEEALDEADVVLIFLSRNSVKKEGFVQRELNYAWELSLEKPRGVIFLIPFRLDDCEVPRFLRSRQWGDYFSNKEKGTYQNLLRSLKQRYLQKMKLEAEEQEQREEVEREAAEKAALEKIEHEAKERADREAAEKLAREKIELEAREKLAHENVERETLVKAAREKTERETREKLTRGEVERDAAEKAKRETRVVPVVKKPIVIKPEPKKHVEIKLPLWGNGLIAFAMLVLIIWGLSSIPNSSKFAQTPFSQLTLTPSARQTLFVKPGTETPIPVTNTATIITTPTLGIGSIMNSEKDGATLVYVPEGEFTMGSDDGNSDEKPAHFVYLDAFWIDQTEVTNKQYQACVDAGICEPPSSKSSYKHPNYYGNPEFDDYPVVYVNWDKANRYCEIWAGGDLPTEAQWEKGARGTDANIYPWGNGPPNWGLLNYDLSVGDTTEVGSYETGKSFYGAYDMAGNVWEWMNDWYQSNYYVTLGNNVSNPQGPSNGVARVLRGGSWFNNDSIVSYARSAIRFKFNPSVTYYDIGFRCGHSLP